VVIGQRDYPAWKALCAARNPCGNDTVTIAIPSTNYTLYGEESRTLWIPSRIYWSSYQRQRSPTAMAFFAERGSGSFDLSSIGSNLARHDYASSALFEPRRLTANRIRWYLSAAQPAATGSAGMLVEVTAPTGVSFTTQLDTRGAPCGPLSSAWARAKCTWTAWRRPCARWARRFVGLSPLLTMGPQQHHHLCAYRSHCAM